MQSTKLNSGRPRLVYLGSGMFQDHWKIIFSFAGVTFEKHYTSEQRTKEDYFRMEDAYERLQSSLSG